MNIFTISLASLKYGYTRKNCGARSTEIRAGFARSNHSHSALFDASHIRVASTKWSFRSHSPVLVWPMRCDGNSAKLSKR